MLLRRKTLTADRETRDAALDQDYDTFLAAPQQKRVYDWYTQTYRVVTVQQVAKPPPVKRVETQNFASLQATLPHAASLPHWARKVRWSKPRALAALVQLLRECGEATVQELALGCDMQEALVRELMAQNKESFVCLGKKDGDKLWTLIQG